MYTPAQLLIHPLAVHFHTLAAIVISPPEAQKTIFVASRLVLEPVCDEPLGDVNVNLPQLSITRIHELVRQVRGDNDDLSCVRFKRGGADREGGRAFLYDENLLVGMLVQAYHTSWRHVYPDKRNFGILVLDTLELIGTPITRQFISVKNGVIHIGLH